jgi:hypothetical protein
MRFGATPGQLTAVALSPASLVYNLLSDIKIVDGACNSIASPASD